MTFGEFLKELFSWLYRFWPIRIVHDWEQGVRCRFGRVTSLLTSSNGLFSTGLHCLWPLVGSVHIEETNIEVSETELQTHTTKEGVNLTFSLGVKYRINDLTKMYRSIHDAADTIYNEICSSAGNVVMEMQYEDVSHNICDALMEDVREEMNTWGIEIISISLINLTRAKPIRLIMDT